jgi:hypothetical protein
MDFELTPAMVVWHDAHVGTDGWEDYVNLEDDGPCVVNSCGFLLPTDKGGKENHISMVATVPSGEHETEELLKCYNFVQQIIDHEAA